MSKKDLSRKKGKDRAKMADLEKAAAGGDKAALKKLAKYKKKQKWDHYNMGSTPFLNMIY